MKLFFLFLFIVLFSCFVRGQSTTSDSLKQFRVDSAIIQDNRVNELILKHILINEAKKGKTEGYRVQIHFGSEKASALDMKSKFTTQYQNIPVYLDYQQPYFKVRVGDFRTKLEAYKFAQEISVDFPGSFIVRDEIELPPL
jgi:hypothetical protein